MSTTTTIPTRTYTMKKTDPRVSRAKTKLINWIETLPMLEFTSGDVSKFINERKSYRMAWDMLRESEHVRRIGPARGTKTTWRRNKTS